MKQVVFVSAIVLVVAGCAKRPDAIAPTAIPMEYYTGNCDVLENQLVAEKENLGELSKQQTNAATGDVWGVFLIGVPIYTAFGGDKAGKVSISKGKIIAIESAMRKRKCKP